MSMTSDQILRYIEDPSSLNERTLGELREILDEYPYFQTAHLLHIRNLQMEHNFRFTSQLKTCSAYATDRTILYHLLNPRLARQGINDLNVQLIKQDLPMIELSDDAVENQTKPEQRVNPLNAPLGVGHDELLNFELPETSYVLEGIENDHEKPLDESPDEISHLPGRIRKGKPMEQKVDLIDRFIKDNPAITIRPAENSGTNKVIDDQSDNTGERDEFITETLARIYMNQGLYKKAINAFEKLSLKYPEKNAYFARQIEEITNLINK